VSKGELEGILTHGLSKPSRKMNMSNFKDLIGKVFERLTVTRYCGVNQYHQSLWECVCICGSVVIVKGKNLVSGHTKSCGCLVRKQFCPKNHDTYIVGRDKSGRCSQCVKEKPKPAPALPKLFCVHGHEIEIVGRNKWGSCNGCKKVPVKRSKKELKEKREKRTPRTVEKIRAYTQKYYLEHKDVFQERYNNKRQELIEYQLERYYNNQKELLDYQKEYNKTHPEISRLNSLRQHKKRRKRIPNFGQEGIFEFYENCHLDMEIDHIIPLCGRKVSGLHVSWNLQYLTPQENRSKGKRVDLIKASEEYGKLLEQLGLK